MKGKSLGPRILSFLRKGHLKLKLVPSLSDSAWFLQRDLSQHSTNMKLSLFLISFASLAVTFNCLPDINLCLDEVFHGLNHPVNAEYTTKGTLILAEREGYIKQLDLLNQTSRTILDLTDQVLTSTDPREERGLLGFTIRKDVPEIYVSYSKVAPKDSKMDHILAISKFVATYHEDDIYVDKDSEKTVIEINQPGRSKNGGHIFFGPDSLLYIAVGAGSHIEIDVHRYKKSSLLGKLLRINVSNSMDNKAYSIPYSNPYYLDQDNDTRKEIFASGFRNPWRCHVDLKTSQIIGDSELVHPNFRIICGDVGGGRRNTDEVDIVENGGIYGWMDLPNTPCVNLDECQALKRRGDIPVFNIFPIYTHKHEIMQALIGGTVYKGSLITSLKDIYIYGDYIYDSMHYLKEDNYGMWSPGNITIVYKNKDQMEPTRNFLVSFAEDPQGEILALKYKISGDKTLTGGAVFKIQPEYMCNSATGMAVSNSESMVTIVVILLNIFFLSSVKSRNF